MKWIYCWRRAVDSSFIQRTEFKCGMIRRCLDTVWLSNNVRDEHRIHMRLRFQWHKSATTAIIQNARVFAVHSVAPSLLAANNESKSCVLDCLIAKKIYILLSLFKKKKRKVVS